MKSGRRLGTYEEGWMERGTTSPTPSRETSHTGLHWGFVWDDPLPVPGVFEPWFGLKRHVVLLCRPSALFGIRGFDRNWFLGVRFTLLTLLFKSSFCKYRGIKVWHQDSVSSLLSHTRYVVPGDTWVGSTSWNPQSDLHR